MIEKSSINGPNRVRTDVLLSSRQDDTERIWLKLWRSSAELLKDVVIGQVIICYAVRTTIFNGEVELMNTDETSIEIHTIEEQYHCRRLIIKGFDDNSLARNVKVVTSTRDSYFMNREQFDVLKQHRVPVKIKGKVFKNLITQCSVEMGDENVEVQGQCNAETVKVTGVETDEKTAGELEGECSAETDMVTSAETDKTTGGQVEWTSKFQN